LYVSSKVRHAKEEAAAKEKKDAAAATVVLDPRHKDSTGRGSSTRWTVDRMWAWVVQEAAAGRPAKDAEDPGKNVKKSSGTTRIKNSILAHMKKHQLAVSADSTLEFVKPSQCPHCGYRGHAPKECRNRPSIESSRTAVAPARRVTRSASSNAPGVAEERASD
jgi:hypothetical protein